MFILCWMHGALTGILLVVLVDAKGAARGKLCQKFRTFIE